MRITCCPFRGDAEQGSARGDAEHRALQSALLRCALGAPQVVRVLCRELDACTAAARRHRRNYHAWTHRLLVARRLVQAGARFVSLTYGSWDNHFNIAPSIGSQLPAFDHALAGLLRDLIERDLFDSTLVVVTTEFGRTPKINSNAGRDHWSRVFSVLLAGAGIKRGTVHGSSNLTAGEPESGAMSAQDLLTTVYHLIGIVADKELMAPGERPVEIVKNGHVVKELLT